MKVLKVEQIVVCGHSHCGAITGVLRPELVRDLPAVEKWLAHAERVRQEIDEQQLRSTDGDDDLLTTAIKANVLVQLEHLRTYRDVAEAEDRRRAALSRLLLPLRNGRSLGVRSRRQSIRVGA